MKKLLNLWVKLLTILFPKKIEKVDYVPLDPLPELPPEPRLTNEEKFVKLCIEGLGTDVSPDDIVKDEVGCAESISNLIKKIFPDFPILVSTRDLHNRLSLDSRFQATLDRGKGRIVVSPRTTNTFGHTGVFMDDDSIASNDSNSGKFVINYTWNSWIREFRDRRKLRIFIYKIN